MSDSNDNPSAPDDAVLDIVDPLGEIRSLAKELWKKDGSPPERTWRHYWSNAESLMLSGRSGGESSGRVRNAAPPPTSEVPAEITAAIEQSESLLLNVIASAFKRALSQEEGASLAHILQTHRLSLKSGAVLGPVETEAIADVLARLVADYDSEALASFGGSMPGVEVRRRFWTEKLAADADEDQPLTYADRNTIRRLRGELACEPRVAKIDFSVE